MIRRLLTIAVALVLLGGGAVAAQESAAHDAGALFGMGGVHYIMRDALTGGLAGADTMANLRGELGFGLLGRNNPNLAPFLYGGDFRIMLSAAQAGAVSAAFIDAPLRAGFGAQFGDLMVAAFAGPGFYSAFLTSGGDATRAGFGFEAGVKAILTWGLYVEASYYAPEALAMLQESLFLDPQQSGFRVGVGWNVLSATPREIQEMAAEAEAEE
jgi:hypothetical protein